MDGPGFEFQQGKKLFSFFKHLDLFWGPYSLLFNGYWSYFPRGREGGGNGMGLKLTIRLHLVPTLRMSGALPLPSWRGQGLLYLHISVQNLVTSVYVVSIVRFFLMFQML
jgi:hypothetical protein